MANAFLSELDSVLNETDTQPEVKPKAKKGLNQKDLKTLSEKAGRPVVTANTARLLGSSTGIKPPSFEDEVNAALSGQKAAPITLVAATPEELKTIDDSKKITSDFEVALENTLNPGFKLKNYDTKKGSEILDTALTALGIEEHVTVAGISKALGLPKKEDLSDYTYTNLLKDFGADPDHIMTDALGLGMAVFLSPSTYVSFGTTGVARIGAKVAGKTLETTLTKSGQKVVNEVIKSRAEKKIAELGGEALTRVRKNKIIAEESKIVEEEIVKKFSNIKKEGDQLKISKDVGNLSSDIFDQGGIKYYSVLDGKEKTLIKGETIAKYAYDNGLVKITEQMQSTIGQTRLGKVLSEGLITPTKEWLDTAIAYTKQPFVNKVQNKDLLRIWQDSNSFALSQKQKITNITSKFFSGLNDLQQKDFAESALQASKKKDKVFVRSLSGDEKVQERLDRWYGQGRHANKTSISNKIATWSKDLMGDEKLENWFPGILDDFNIDQISLKTGKQGDRSFLTKRLKDKDDQLTEFAKYTRDPVKAVAYRATEVTFANIQDQMYKNIIKDGLGDARKFKTPEEAARQGYTILRNPRANMLVGAGKSSDELVYVKEEFAEQWESLITKQKGVYVPGLSELTTLFKTYVTSTFPSFHARNFYSNLILNSYSIGGHAVNPKRMSQASRLLSGKNLDEMFKTQRGEKFTYRELINEAKSNGVLKGNQFVSDIFGERFDSETQNVISKILFDNLLVKGGRKIGEAIENHGRIVNYMTWRERGLSPRLAALEVDKALFDYSDLTRGEQYAKLMLPFYTFSRKNLEAHLRLLVHEPGEIANQLKFIREVGPTDEEWDNAMPDYVKDKMVMRFRGNFYQGFGLPIEDILGLADSPARKTEMLLNPLFRYPLEKRFGEDFYSGRKIDELNSAKEFTAVLDAIENPKYPDAFKAPLKEVRDFLKLERDPSNPDKVIGDPDKLHILRNMFTSRFQSMLGFLQSTDRYNSKEQARLETSIRFVLGVSRINVDEELLTNIKRREAFIDSISEVVKTNSGKRIVTKTGPFLIFTDKRVDKVYNKALERMMKADDVTEVNAIRDELKEEIREIRKERVED